MPAGLSPVTPGLLGSLAAGLMTGVGALPALAGRVPSECGWVDGASATPPEAADRAAVRLQVPSPGRDALSRVPTLRKSRRAPRGSSH